MGGSAGFGTWAAQLERVYRDPTNEELHKAAHNEIADAAALSVPPSNALYGRPSSAIELAEAHKRKIQKIATVIKNGGVGENGERYTTDDLSAAVASAAGIYDAMAGASPNGANAFANVLMKADVGVGYDYIDFKRDDNGNVVHDDNNNAVTETKRVEGGTVREYIQRQMNGNAAFANRRRDYGQSLSEEAARQQQATAQPQPPGQSPGQRPPGGPPILGPRQ
jgi:hypothetical protein